MLKDDIQQAVFANLKEKKATEVKVLRFVLSEIQYAEIAKQKDLTDEEVITLLQKETKKRKEAIEMFKKGKRDDLVADEEKQIIIIEKYLPKQMPQEEVERIVDAVLAGTNDKSNTGKLIGLVMAQVKGKTDGGIVAQLVRQKLAKTD